MSDAPNTVTNDGSEPVRVKAKKHKKHKSSSRSHQRSYSEERLYHGAVVGDEFLDGRAAGEPAPIPSATTAGPLLGDNCRVGMGGWGALKAPRSLTASAPAAGGGGDEAKANDNDDGTPLLPSSYVLEATGVGVATADGRKRDVRGGESEDAFAAIVDVFEAYGEPRSSKTTTLSQVGSETVAVVAVEEVVAEGDTSGAVADASAAKKDMAGDEEKEGGKATAKSEQQSKEQQEQQRQQVSAVVTVGERGFHLFGVYDGHRSNHAARFCAEALGPELTRRLKAKGVLKPIGVEIEKAVLHGASGGGAAAGGGSEKSAGDTKKEEGGGEKETASAAELKLRLEAAEKAEAAAAVQEEKAVAAAFKEAVVAVDDDFCDRRWVSLVRDNGKKFYLTRVQGVPLDFEMAAWDTYPLEHAWRSSLATVSDQHARKSMGLTNENDLRMFGQEQQERWHCYKKELYPGCALCAVLVDASRGKMYCANTGDCGALLYSTRHSAHPYSPSSSSSPALAGEGAGASAVGVASPSDQQLANTLVPLSAAETLNGGGGGGKFAIGFPNNGNTQPRDDSDSEDDEEEEAAAGGAGGGGAALPYGKRGVSGRRFVMLSRPHKPADMAELQRVCSTPRGFVEVHGQRVFPSNSSAVAEQVALAHSMGRKALYRINRDVSLSRAMGDLDLKEFGVTSEPDVTVYDLANCDSTTKTSSASSGGSAKEGEEAGDSAGSSGDGDEFTVVLAIASDGVWDVISPRQCAAMMDESADVATLLSFAPDASGSANTNNKALPSSGGGAATSDEKENESSAVTTTTTTDQDGANEKQLSPLSAAATRTSTTTTTITTTAAMAAAASSSLAKSLVDAAVGIVKNNDDVTAVVASLRVKPRNHLLAAAKRNQRLRMQQQQQQQQQAGANATTNKSSAAPAPAAAASVVVASPEEKA